MKYAQHNDKTKAHVAGGRARLRGMLCMFISLSLASCGLRGESVGGRALVVRNPEASSSRWVLAPLDGADILVIWRGNLVDNMADSRTICLRAVRTRTDPDGRFDVDGWWQLPQARVVTDVEATWYAFKPGYEYVWQTMPGSHEAPVLNPGEKLLRPASGNAGANAWAGWEQEARNCGRP